MKPTGGIIPDLPRIATETLLDGRRRETYAGTTNADGKARINATLTSSLYPYAISIAVFEDKAVPPMHLPSGIGDAIFVIQDLTFNPTQLASGFSTPFGCIVQAKQKYNQSGEITDAVESHDDFKGTLNVAVYVEYAGT
jgi:hypothetical protein